MKTMTVIRRSTAVLTLGLALSACGNKAEDAAKQAAAAAKEAAQAQEVAAKNDQRKLTEKWNTLSYKVPGIVEVVTARVEFLGKEGKLPQGLDPQKFDAAKTASEAMTQSWQQALGAFANDNMQEAVAQAQVAMDKGSECMTALGLNAPT